MNNQHEQLKRREFLPQATQTAAVAFASSNDANLIALGSRTGKCLWHYDTGARIVASPMSYAVNGKPYVAVASHSAIFVFGLP